MLVHCKSQEVYDIVIILNKTSHALSLTLQFVIFKQVQAATVCARSSCTCTIGTVWFMVCSDAFFTFLGWLSLFLHHFSQ